ncbi:MAG: hypothetical protein AAF703_18025 [Cyanobacteria bacterium P01_D01_bin.105]
MSAHPTQLPRQQFSSATNQTSGQGQPSQSQSDRFDVPHPWPTGHIFESLGAHLSYRVTGPCCRLYDREQLPWPCCRIQWHSKEPSWRRIGKRFIPDLATRKHPSYCVEIVGQSYRSEPIVMTLYTEKLPAELQNWWHTKRCKF